MLTLAVAATDWLAPPDALRRQFALLPPAKTVSALPALARLRPAQLETLHAAAGPGAARPARASLASALAPAPVEQAPPSGTLVATPATPDRVSKCVAPRELAAAAIERAPLRSVSPQAFGRRLAQAALAQTRDLVVYTDAYRQIGFPMGDIPDFYGVCTDVVVRAYRALGVDLQVLVHRARVGTGDPNIDHRRTDTLRRFFTLYGVSLPVTDFAEDYRPGDIVTYHRPSGRTSQSHIAIVADVIAPSGRPMIVHNRGWGPQLEDALFASRITGHFRFMPEPPDDSAADHKRPPADGTQAASQTASPVTLLTASASR